MRLPPTNCSPRSKSSGRCGASAWPSTIETSTFPYENLAEAKEAGLNRLTVPKEYGGFGYWMPGNFSGLYRLLERMAYWDTNTAQLLQVHNHAAGIIAFHSSPAQRDRFLPQIVDGAYLASLGSEAHLYENGAEALASELTAVDGGYRLTARKAFASVAAIAKYLMVWCAVEGDTAYAGRMVFAVVPTDAPGVTLLDDWHMLGMRSTVSCSVAFEDVFVPDGRRRRRARRLDQQRSANVLVRLRVQPPRHGAGRVRLHCRVRRQPRRPQLLGGSQGSSRTHGRAVVRRAQRAAFDCRPAGPW